MKWTYSRKKKLLDKINRITNKEDMVTIFNIIKKENKPYKELKNSILMFFHDLQDETYDELKKFVNSLVLKEKPKKIFVKDYVPYTEDKNDNYTTKEKTVLWNIEKENELNKQNEKDIVYESFRCSYFL